MLSIKQGGIKYYFLSFWYGSTWDWAPVSRTIGEHSNHNPVSKLFVLTLSTWNYNQLQTIIIIIIIIIYTLEFSHQRKLMVFH